MRADYEARIAALKPRFELYEKANRVNVHPWLADLVIWRAKKSASVLNRMIGVLNETSNPGNLVSLKGIRRLFWSRACSPNACPRDSGKARHRGAKHSRGGSHGEHLQRGGRAFPEITRGPGTGRPHGVVASSLCAKGTRPRPRLALQPASARRGHAFSMNRP